MIYFNETDFRIYQIHTRTENTTRNRGPNDENTRIKIISICGELYEKSKEVELK